MASIVPEDPKAGYDMVDFINAFVDDDSLLQVKELYARELITGFARLDGKPIGIVASQPNHLGGVLFVDSATRPLVSSGCATRSTCRSFSWRTYPDS